MTKPAFPTILKELYEQGFTKKPNNIIAGFKKAALCPLGKESVSKSKIKSSSTLIPASSSTPILLCICSHSKVYKDG